MVLSYRLILILLMFPALLKAQEFNPVLEKEYLQTISSYLLIEDYTDAVNKAQEAVSRLPHSKPLRELYIHSLSKAGDERRLLQAWQVFSHDFCSGSYEEPVLEDVAWGLIHKAHLSDNLATKFTSLVAASIQNDALSVDTLQEMLEDKNALIREIAVHFAGNFGDRQLNKQLLVLLEDEPVHEVRKRILEVLTRLKLPEAKEKLEALLSQETITHEEKAIAVSALLQYYDHLDEKQFEKLCISSKLVDRYLACRAFTYFDLEAHADLLAPLVQDCHRSIRIEALSALSQKKIDPEVGSPLFEALKKALDDPSPKISLLAHWALLKQDSKTIKSELRRFLFHSDQSMRLTATTLICYALPLCTDLAHEVLNAHPDPYVRANIAFYLASQRKDLDPLVSELVQFFKSEKAYVLHAFLPLEVSLFTPSQLAGIEKDSVMMRSTSFLEHQRAQLELLNLLALVESKEAKKLMSIYLDQHQSDVLSLNLSHLLHYEETHAFDLMKDFLNHPDKHKQAEAAIVLALFKKDDSALKILESLYPQSNRELKQSILMAFGEVASKESIPFLMQQMYDTSQTIRIQAAAALVKCLRN